MKNFIFKSSDADLQKMFQYIETAIGTLNKNVLYSTRIQDSILKIVKELNTDKGLQRQVDEYFEETSPQTESVEQ